MTLYLFVFFTLWTEGELKLRLPLLPLLVSCSFTATSCNKQDISNFLTTKNVSCIK